MLSPLSADQVIREAGLRSTSPRVAVFDALRAQPHATAETIWNTVKSQSPQSSVQSVYNALSDFEKAGLVRRVELAGHPGRFELRVGDNHHHLVCSECGRVEDVECVTGQAPCLDFPQPSGYAVTRAEVTFWGVCTACALEPTSQTTLAHRPQFSPRKDTHV